MPHRSSVPLLAVVVLLLAFPSILPAPAGCSWAPSYTDIVGVSVVNMPKAGEEVAQVSATVTNPARMSGLGFRGVQKGDPVTLTLVKEESTENDGFWVVKNERTGESKKLNLYRMAKRG